MSNNQPLKLTGDELLLMNIFEGITDVSPLTCRLVNDMVFFIIHEREVYRMLINKPLVSDVQRYLKTRKYTPSRFVSGLARLLSENLGKKVYVVIYNDSLIDFIRNFFGLNRSDSINVVNKEDGSTYIYITVSPDRRGMVIGKNGVRAKVGREFARAFFNVSNILIK